MDRLRGGIPTTQRRSMVVLAEEARAKAVEAMMTQHDVGALLALLHRGQPADVVLILLVLWVLR